MSLNKELVNPVNLKKLTSHSQFSDLNLILKDDLWNKEILLLKSGKYLTERIINKLINMGIFEVNVSLDEETYYQEEVKAVNLLKSNFVKSQTAFILNKELQSASTLVKGLVNHGFTEKNLFVFNKNTNLIQYFKTKKPSYIFLDNDFYTENHSLIRDIFSTIRNPNIFLLIKSEKSKINVCELESRLVNLGAKIILKPLNLSHLRILLNNCIDNDFYRLFNNEKSVNREISKI